MGWFSRDDEFAAERRAAIAELVEAEREGRSHSVSWRIRVCTTCDGAMQGGVCVNRGCPEEKRAW